MYTHIYKYTHICMVLCPCFWRFLWNRVLLFILGHTGHEITIAVFKWPFLFINNRLKYRGTRAGNLYRSGRSCRDIMFSKQVNFYVFIKNPSNMLRLLTSKERLNLCSWNCETGKINSYPFIVKPKTGKVIATISDKY